MNTIAFYLYVDEINNIKNKKKTIFFIIYI